MTFKISSINTTKNLLAFSGGVDSSALFFILLENKIPFDIAIVDYNIRKESKEEVAYAKELAKKYNKEIFIKEVKLDNQSNFEKKARDIRYTFFEEIIEKNSYKTLITAHQLNDKLEWLLMQFSKGAGLVELLSFEEFTKNEKYTTFKPLINSPKKALITYLEEKKIKYFIDNTNNDENYKRNYFRKNFSNSFLDEFEEGIKRSFEYLEKDLNSLEIKTKPLINKKELEIFHTQKDENKNIRIIDKSLKKRGFLLSSAQRIEILKQKEIVVSHKISISITDKYIYITPYLKNIKMEKNFKEKCRIKKLPKNIRAYIYKEDLLDNLMV